MQWRNWPSWCLLLTLIIFEEVQCDDNDYNVLHRDGSFEFGYDTPDSYHHADGNRNNVVRGEFGGRNPGTGAIDSTIYTAGPRGFRPRGKNVHRKYDLGQAGGRPIGSKDDPYYDPYEDPSYNFAFRTRTYTRQENANRVGDVNGRYSYVDDVGERHNVEFIAGKNTGFHVKTPFPDSNPRAYGPLYFNGRGKPLPRGRTSIQRGLDGSYRFVSAGPDQRRTETSDSSGHVRGSYTYLDDKGVQHSVHYIAGPETGYRVLKNVKGPHLPTVFPFGRPGILPSDFYDYVGKDNDLFDTAASGHVKPPKFDSGGSKPGSSDLPNFDNGIDVSKEDFDKFNNDLGKPSSTKSPFRPTTVRPNKPFGGNKPGGSRPGGSSEGFGDSYDDNGDDFGDDLFGGFGGGSSSTRPPFSSTTSKPIIGGSDDGSYKPAGGDGSYNPGSDDGSYKPTDDGSYKPDLPSPGFTGGTTSRPGGVTTFKPKPTYGPPRPVPTDGRPSSRPGGRPSGRPGGRPGGSSSSKPGLGFGSGDYDDGGDYDEFNFGLFGSESNSRPPKPPPTIQLGVDNRPGTGSKPGGSGCTECKHTIVTNVGDTLFTVPPGVSVRAHVQAIDLLPVISKIPSPSDQYKADAGIRTEQLNESTNDVVNRSQTDSTTEKADSTNTTPSSTSTIPTTTTNNSS